MHQETPPAKVASNAQLGLLPRRADFSEVCAMLPEGTNWGDRLTPAIAREIIDAAGAAERKRCANACEALPSFGPDDESAEWYGFALLACAAAIRGPNSC